MAKNTKSDPSLGDAMSETPESLFPEFRQSCSLISSGSSRKTPSAETKEMEILGSSKPKKAKSGKTKTANFPNLIQLYVKEVWKTNLLNQSAEQELACFIREGKTLIEQNGDDPELTGQIQDAEDFFIRANLRYVINLARKMVNKGIEFPDLIQEGNIGLITAVRKF